MWQPGFWCEGQQKMDFFTGGSVIMDYGILVKNVLMMDLFQLLSSRDVNWWTGEVWVTSGLLWCFYQLFGLSFWRHPFTAEDPLLRQWCDAVLMLCFADCWLMFYYRLIRSSISSSIWFSVMIWRGWRSIGRIWTAGSSPDWRTSTDPPSTNWGPVCTASTSYTPFRFSRRCAAHISHTNQKKKTKKSLF